MGVVIRRYIDILLYIIITYPYSTCGITFLATASLLLCSFLNVFFVLVLCTLEVKNSIVYKIILRILFQRAFDRKASVGGIQCFDVNCLYM